MRALQLHYTSCRRGQSGSSGFQTRTLTSGIRPDEQREIERRGVYRPPRDVKPEPSEEEMNRDFPRALRCYALESGRRVLTRSLYTGRDYSGRWGNFFAHTLVVENGELPPHWPIDYYEWEGWKERLAPDEDGDEPPPSLPAVDLGAVAPAESFRREEIREFLGEDPTRPALLARMGRALLLGRESSRALVLRDTPTNGLFWIAALQKLFPRRHAWALSYSTYQDDARGCADVNATTGETDFRFDESERRFRFYMFDLATGLHSEVPESADDYPAVAARWLAEDPQSLEDFEAFLSFFEHDRPEPELVSAVHLFELSRGRLGPLAGAKLAGMIAFASRYATAEGKVALLETLGTTAARPGALDRPEDGALLLPFLSEGARATGRPEHRSLVFAAWSALLRDHVLARGAGLEIAEAAWTRIRSELSGHGAELSAHLLAQPVWREPRQGLTGRSPELLSFLLRITRTSLREVGRQPVWTQPEIAAIAEAMLAGEGDVTEQCMPVLQAAGDDAAALSSLARLAVKIRENGKPSEPVQLGVGRALGRALATVPPEVALETRRSLEAEENWRLLLGEWMDLCERARDPLAALERYRREVLDAMPAYRKTCGSSIAFMALRHVPEAQRPAVALRWLIEGDVDRFPDKTAGECVKLAHLAVPLDPDDPEGDKAADCVARAALRLKLPLEPDRPRLRQALITIQQPGRLPKPLLNEVGKAVPGLGTADYDLLVSRFLLAALEKAGSRGEHQDVLLAVLHPGEIESLRRSYLAFFAAKRKSSWPEPLQAALRLWLEFDRRTGGPEAVRLASLERTAREGILGALSRLKPKELQKIDTFLRKARIQGLARKTWEELLEALEKKRRSPWSKLKSVFVRS
jgi:hypothetical protein